MKRTAVALLVLLIPIAVLAQEPEQAQERSEELEQAWGEVIRLLAEAQEHSKFLENPRNTDAELWSLEAAIFGAYKALVVEIPNKIQAIMDRFGVQMGVRLSGFSVSTTPPSLQVQFAVVDTSESNGPDADNPEE